MLHAKGPLLTIDVTDQSYSTSNIDDVLESCIGGRAVATTLAHDRIPFDADPLGEENRVYLSTGPLQQSMMSFTGRMNLTAISPLTNGLASANAGGFLSRNFCDTGISVLEMIGESEELLAIHVGDDGVEFEAVPELKHALIPEVSDHISNTRDLGPENCMAIGPAGENLVRFASVMTFNSRAFGRGGLGAVLGAKNVKCVTFEGDSAPSIEIPSSPTMDIHREAAQSDDRKRRQGTTGGTRERNDFFSLPTRYFEEYKFEGVAGIDGDAVEKKKYKKGTCSACAFACKLPTRDEAEGIETEGPEYETVYAYGSSQAVDDIVDVMKANELCDIYGLDTISAGITIAAYLKSEKEFGNAELARELTEKIAYREGVGDLLAEGVHRSHKDLGVHDYTVKGLELAAHDGRVLHGQGLSYAVSNRGADHLYSGMMVLEYNGVVDPEGTLGKAETLVDQENHSAFFDSGIVCVFGGKHVTRDRLEEIFDADSEELMGIGSRTVELERHFNNQRGFDGSDDILPYDIPDLEEAIQEYYKERGWNQDGTVPTENIGTQSVSAD